MTGPLETRNDGVFACTARRVAWFFGYGYEIATRYCSSKLGVRETAHILPPTHVHASAYLTPRILPARVHVSSFCLCVGVYN